MACSSSCQTQDHATFGECLRSKRIQVADPEAYGRARRMYRAIDNYADARRSGLQPDGIYQHQTDAAWKETERTGKPYRGDQPFVPTEE